MSGAVTIDVPYKGPLMGVSVINIHGRTEITEYRNELKHVNMRPKQDPDPKNDKSMKEKDIVNDT